MLIGGNREPSSILRDVTAKTTKIADCDHEKYKGGRNVQQTRKERRYSEAQRMVENASPHVVQKLSEGRHITSK